MGLDEAGKTSILLAMAGDYDPSKIKPTFGAERTEISVLGFPIYRWDLGGQEQYRDGYLDKFDKYVQGVTKMIFVIDVQDIARYRSDTILFPRPH